MRSRSQIRPLLCAGIAVVCVFATACNNKKTIDMGRLSKEDQIKSLKPSAHSEAVAARIRANMAAGKPVTAESVSKATAEAKSGAKAQ